MPGVPDGPVVQSLRIGFRTLYLGTLLLALGWLASNCRQVPADSQIVVRRFGQIVRVQPAGLLLAWPRPIEQVDLLPAAARQIELTVAPQESATPGAAGTSLTGDGGAVLLRATLTWHVVDPVAYDLAQAHVVPALNRLFAASVTTLAAGRSIDDFLVVRSGQEGSPDAAEPMVQAQRQALRGDLVTAINRRLRALELQGAPLGVEVTRADINAQLPPAAKPGFDAVLAATQRVEEGLAAARTQATLTLQTGDRDHDRILTEARATAEETVDKARAQVAAIAALEAGDDPAGRAGLLERLYRDRVTAVLGQAGHLLAVDPRGGPRLILPGNQPSSN
ncbi:SPFH domain-containing protein [Rhodopila globiformis]|nr:SPFH domain-containing protein [Rhodopila globiformis]